MACGWIDALPSGDFKDTFREVTCGTIGHIIRTVGSVVGAVTGDAIKLVEETIDDPLSLPGNLFSFVGDFFERARRAAAVIRRR